MLDPIGNFINAIVTNAQGVLLLAVLALAILVGGYKYMTNDGQDGRRWIVNGLIGGALALSAVSMAGLAASMLRGGGVVAP